MTRRLPGLLLALAALFCAASAEAAKPNFIIINVDDLGYADIGPYGSDNRTPHLDRMAAEGRLLTSHYAAPVCSPSRAALLTGCYPKRVLPIQHVLFPAAAVGLHPDEVTPSGLIGDWTEEVDWSVGQILDTLRELELDQNTFVLFTSDNGGSLRHGSFNHPLRGAKGSTFEGGMRVCTIAWWPGKIPAGTRTDAITSMMDLLPTLANLAGAALPDDRKWDGVDQWPVLADDVQTGCDHSSRTSFRNCSAEKHWRPLSFTNATICWQSMARSIFLPIRFTAPAVFVGTARQAKGPSIIRCRVRSWCSRERRRSFPWLPNPS